jgi:drug/metabolite transporter (DMT)-like permease
MSFLGERARGKSRIGILLALLAIVLLSYQPPTGNGFQGYGWLLLAALVLLMWGVQGFVMKLANESTDAESIFFYMAASAVLLIPVALYMTDFSQPINTGWDGPWLASGIHLLNSIGALTLVYAMRYGKAIIVVPLTGLSPVITILLSLAIYAVIPHPVTIAGLIIAVIAIYLITE